MSHPIPLYTSFISRDVNPLLLFPSYHTIEAESKIGDSSLSTDSRVSKVSKFREGDMVRGKVKSHPWWPGQIFNPALATTMTKRSRRSDCALVAFFGDATFGWFVNNEIMISELFN